MAKSDRTSILSSDGSKYINSVLSKEVLTMCEYLLIERPLAELELTDTKVVIVGGPLNFCEYELAYRKALYSYDRYLIGYYKSFVVKVRFSQLESKIIKNPFYGAEVV